VIPAYNEEGAIVAGIDTAKHALDSSGWKFEIVVVDDGSTDATARLAAEQGVEVVRLGVNQGYGAALKAGIARAKFQWVAIIDADGTYPANALPAMLERTESSDMVVGARVGSHSQDPFARRPAKWALRKFAGLLAGQTIPDLNSGMRVLRKSLVDEFAGILPSGFSFTTTITLAMISRGYSVAYVPIDYFKRVGRSKIKPFHAFKFAYLIVRTIMLCRFRGPNP
jgi:glycosyltransferase involved in cell wall biosynthesis